MSFIALLRFLASDLFTCVCRGKTSFDQSGVGAEQPGEVQADDDEFDLYRKRMMLAYRFRPNPLVNLLVYIVSF